MKLYKCCYCKKRFKKKDMRASYGADILLYSHACLGCIKKVGGIII